MEDRLRKIEDDAGSGISPERMERSDRITGGNAEMEKYIGKYSVKDFLYLILGAFIYSIGTHSFIETANIAPGGASGIALMVNFVTGLPVGTLTLVLNVRC